MTIPFKKDSKTKRKEELRNILDPEHVHKRDPAGRGPKGRFYALRRYVAEHNRVLLAALLVAVCLITQIYYYNRLTAMKQQVNNLRSQIESGLQMRQNIVPALTVAVSQFLSHEKGVFLSAVKARENSLSMPKDMEKLVQSLKEISGRDFSPNALSRFMAVAENYPRLVSSESYQLLIAQIVDVENQIYNKRIEYNDAVNLYNTRLSTFPGNAAGWIMFFRLEPYFEWDKKPEWVFAGTPPGGNPADLEPGEPPLRMKSEKSDLKK